MESYRMWIDGEWVNAESGKTFDVFNPTTEEVLGMVPLGADKDVDKAVKAARKAFPAWKKMTQADRSKALYRFATALRENANELVSFEVNEHGTPINLARGFAAAAADHTEYVASIARALMARP